LIIFSLPFPAAGSGQGVDFPTADFSVYLQQEASYTAGGLEKTYNLCK
jgi:hypothetical protein